MRRLRHGRVRRDVPVRFRLRRRQARGLDGGLLSAVRFAIAPSGRGRRAVRRIALLTLGALLAAACHSPPQNTRARSPRASPDDLPSTLSVPADRSTRSSERVLPRLVLTADLD